MIHRRTLQALLIALLATSCATPYGPQGFTGGYTDQKIDETHYRVKFDGNGNSSSERVWTFWMHRCAELTLEKGYSHFSLLRPGEPLSGRRETPTGTRFTNAVYRPDGRPEMVKTKGSGGYIYVPGYTYQVTTWHTDAVVSMHREPLPEYVVVLNAQSVIDALGPYVKSKGNAPSLTREQLFERAARMNRPPSSYHFGGPL